MEYQGFDAVNSKEIADLHGADPRFVLKEIKAVRAFVACFKTRAAK